MPILCRRDAEVRRHGETGLTLVEMLVVLAIIGVIGAATTLSLSGVNRAAGAQAETHRLARSIQLAADEAILTDRWSGLRWDGGGYSFLEWNGARGEWEAHRNDELAVRHSFASGTSLSGSGDAAPLVIGEDIGPPVTFTFRNEGREWKVVFDGLTATAIPDTTG